MQLRRLLAFLCFVALSLSCFAVSAKNLPPRYRDWITKEVNYIITDEEKEAFVHLSSDAERDAFIDRFWAIRNPDPNSPTNTYKEEIYERIAYANQYFGHESGKPGWMTDMGRVYITLGAPKQKSKLYNLSSVVPMEIWFYDNAHPALPPFFYVVFYQRDSTSDFKLYSPYMDGPTKLVTSHHAENGRLDAWQQIDKSAGREVSRTTLSLLPDEPVDINTADSSLQSDVMLNTIKSLANNSFTKDALRTKRELLESVSHRVILTDEFLDVLAVPYRDALGTWNLHYALRLRRPEDFAIGQNSAGNYYVAAEIEARVMTPEGKLLYSQRRDLSKNLSVDEVADLKARRFGYEGVIAIAPGKYKVEFSLLNKLKKTSFAASRNITVPQSAADGLQLSDVIAFTKAAGGNPTDELVPFELSRVKFTPGPADGLTLVQGQDLNVLYQIWTTPTDPKAVGDTKLNVEYAFGRMGMHDTQTVKDEVEKKQFDQSGTLVNGKKINTSELNPGQYRLSITVTDPDSKARAFGSLTFRVLNGQGTPDPWDIVDPDLANDLRSGTFDLDRSLAYFSQSNTHDSTLWLQRAFARNPENQAVVTRLVNIYFAQHQFDRIASAFNRVAISEKSDDQTILRIADSFDRLGQTKKSVEVLESAVNLKPGSGPLFLSLANYYHRLGNNEKANEMERKGRSLVANSNQEPGL